MRRDALAEFRQLGVFSNRALKFTADCRPEHQKVIADRRLCRGLRRAHRPSHP